MIFFPGYAHVLNPDAVSYISIARHYSEGRFGIAVNAYWSPLFSWLTAPWLALGMPPLTAARVALALAGMSAVVGLALLCRAMRLRSPLFLLVLGVSVPIFLWMTFAVITPDLPATAILLFYFAILFSPDVLGHPARAAAAGGVGAIAYLAKSYVLPFVVVHLLLLSAAAWVAERDRSRRSVILRSWLAAMAATAVVAGPWVALISLRSGSFTISTTPRYVRNVRDPQNRGAKLLRRGFEEPAHPRAVSCWEDPGKLSMPHESSPFESGRALRRQAAICARNVRRAFEALCMFSCALPVLLGMLCVLSIRPFRGWIRYRWLSLTVLSVALYCGGYILTYVRPRYLWPIWAVLLAGAGALLSRMFRRGILRRRSARIAAGFLFAVFFAVYPVRALVRGNGEGLKAWRVFETLRRTETPEGRLASNRRFQESLYLAFHLGCPYLGAFDPEWSDDEIREQLGRHRVDYLLFWEDGEGKEEPPAWLAARREITGGRIRNLRIYDLRSGPAGETPPGPSARGGNNRSR